MWGRRPVFMFMCTATAIIVLVQDCRGRSYDGNDTEAEAEVSETQRATCHIVSDKLVASASATFSHALKGVCSKRDLDKQFQTLKVEMFNKLNKMYTIIMETSQQLIILQEVMSRLHPQNSTTKNFLKIKPRASEIMKNNYTMHEDNVTGKTVFSYYWKISEMQDKMKLKNKQGTLSSSAFYVNDGYKLSLKMFPHQEKGNMYIHVSLVNGEHDDQLEWPFRLKHRVTVVDQSENSPEDIVSQIWDPTELCSPSDWQKPSSTNNNEECVGFGFTQDTLLHNSYIFDDSLLIKLDVFI